jgi:hypothetical protein
MESNEIKQNYLRTEVLEKGYDANDFVEYLISMKGEEAGNVENWTIEELALAVIEYKETRQPINKRSSCIDIPENYLVNTYEEIITCNKQDKTALSDCQNLEVKISE